MTPDPIVIDVCQRNAETYYRAARDTISPYQRVHWQEQAARWSARARVAAGIEAPGEAGACADAEMRKWGVFEHAAAMEGATE